MKNIKFLLLTAIILPIYACEGPEYHTFWEGGHDAGHILAPSQPTQHAECELVPQFTFEKNEAAEIVAKCQETTNY
jgi:hypothetical protein